jgi:hypothetical protein
MPRWTPVQLASLVVGAGFLLVGLFGFIPGITTDYNAMTWAGHESEAMLLGMFQVSILHNLIHLAFGVAGLLMAWRFGNRAGLSPAGSRAAWNGTRWTGPGTDSCSCYGTQTNTGI